MPTITKKDLVFRISDDTGLTLQQTHDVVQRVSCVWIVVQTRCGAI